MLEVPSCTLHHILYKNRLKIWAPVPVMEPQGCCVLRHNSLLTYLTWSTLFITLVIFRSIQLWRHIRFSGGQRKKWMSETLYLLPVTPVRHSTFLNIMLIYRNSASLSYMYRGARLTTCLRRYWGDRRPSRASQGRVCTRQLGNNCCLFCISLSEAPKYCTLKFSLRVFTKRVKGEWMNNCKQISLLYIYIYIEKFEMHVPDFENVCSRSSNSSR